MTDDTPPPSRHILVPQIAEMKDGIERLIPPHAAVPGSVGVITLAQLELGIERHLRICPTEASARALLDGVLKKVLECRAAADGH